MSGYFDEQIRARTQSDIDAFTNSFSEISEAITGEKFFYSDNNSALGEIAKFYNLPEEAINKDISMKIFDENGIMYREVKLKEGWYKDASGVYLAKMKDGRDIALMPGYMGYYYKDYETGKKTRINSRTQANIEKEAILFYRKLPDKKLSVKDLIFFAVRSLAISDIISIMIITLLVTLVSMTAPYLLQIIYSQIIYSKNLMNAVAIFTFMISAGISLTLLKILHYRE